MTLYSNEIRQFISRQSWPTGLKYEIVEFDEFLRFRLFRDNINALTGEEKLILAGTLNKVLTKIQGDGIPIYTEVSKGSGWDA